MFSSSFLWIAFYIQLKFSTYLHLSQLSKEPLEEFKKKKKKKVYGLNEQQS